LACLSKLKESIRAASHCSVYHSCLKPLGFLSPRLLAALVMHSVRNPSISSGVIKSATQFVARFRSNFVLYFSLSRFRQIKLGGSPSGAVLASDVVERMTVTPNGRWSENI